MAAVTVWPPISTFTCAVVAPFFTSTILPLSRLRALIFMTPLLKSAISRPRHIGIGEEQLLPVDLVVRDRLLAFGRDEPVDEGLAERLLDVRMLFGIDQHDAVLVEQALVAGDEDVEIAAVLERKPGAAVGEHIGVGRGRGVERRAHALADLLVPGTFLLADVDAGGLPEVEFGDMGARAVAARDEGRALGLDRLQSLGDVGHALDAGGVALRSDQDEIVVHDGVSLHAETVGDEFLLLRLDVHEQHVGVATSAGVERLAGALRHHLHIDAGLGFEQRQDVAEQAGVLRRRGGGDHNGLVLRERGCCGDKRDGRYYSEQAAAGRHDVLLLLGVSRDCDSQTSNSPAANRRASSVLGAEKKASAGPLSTTRPRCISTISPASRLASPRSWVDITTLMPLAATLRITSSIALVAAGSRLAVGSSSRRICGSLASARASASRCCSPPESLRAGRRSSPVRPTSAPSSRAWAPRRARGTPAAASA